MRLLCLPDPRHSGALGVGNARCVQGCRLLLDGFVLPPRSTDAQTLLLVALVFAEEAWLCRAATSGSREYAEFLVRSGLRPKRFKDRVCVRIGRWAARLAARSVAAFWDCGAGRFVLASGSCEEAELMPALEQAYSVGRCLRAVRRIAASRGFSGLSYDNEVVELFCAEAPQQAAARIRWASESFPVPLLVEEES